MEEHRAAEIHLQPLEQPQDNVGGCPKEGSEAMGNSCWVKGLERTCRPEEPILEKVDVLDITKHQRYKTAYFHSGIAQ